MIYLWGQQKHDIYLQIYQLNHNNSHHLFSKYCPKKLDLFLCINTGKNQPHAHTYTEQASVYFSTHYFFFFFLVQARIACSD